jgi:glucose/mannose transport system substrate-binding protein
MLRREFLSMGAVLVLGVASALGCTSNSNSGGPANGAGSGQVEIFSWWTAAGEADALKVITDTYKTRWPSVTVINAAVTGGAGTKAHEQLKQRMQNNLPPDTFQVHGGRELIGAWVQPKGVTDLSANKMEDLGFLFDDQGWNSAFPKQLLDVVSFQGKIYSVPVNIHRGNAVFYNAKIFSDNSIAVPKTLDDLHAAAETLKAKGITPIAIGTKDPWPITMIWEDILLAKGGATFFRDYFSGKGTADDPVITASFTELAKILSYTNDDSATMSWDDAAGKVAKGTAAMTFMGDWAKGFFTSADGGNLTVEKDFGVFPSPGTDGTFIVVTDSFCLPKGAPARANAIELLKVIGDKDVQVKFNVIKGSIPARSDADASSFDAMAKKTIDDFKAAELVPSLANGSAADPEFTNTFTAACGQFYLDRDVNKIVGVLRVNYPQLR